MLTECPDARPSPPPCPGAADTSEEERRSLKLILGAFQPITSAPQPLQSLYYLAHFTDVKTAQKRGSDFSKFSSQSVAQLLGSDGKALSIQCTFTPISSFEALDLPLSVGETEERPTLREAR